MARLNTMNITHETVLMKHEKHATVLTAGSSFDVLQSAEGHSLFFSIGSDGSFYATREVLPGDSISTSTTGWEPINLAAPIFAQYRGSKVAASKFALSQDKQTLAFDMAVVVNVDGDDHLYMALGHENTELSWKQNISWTHLPFNAEGIDGDPSKTLGIADVYLMNIPANADNESPVTNFFLDIQPDPNDALKIVSRYTINLDDPKSPLWVSSRLGEDFSGPVISCPGNRLDDSGVPGMYTFGTIGTDSNDTVSLLCYSPQDESFSPSRLSVPAGASAIAATRNQDGYTSLFIAGDEGLWLYSPNKQTESSKAILVVPSTSVIDAGAFVGATSLSAATVNGMISVWALNAQGDLIYTSCPVGKEADPNSWSFPVPISSGVDMFAFYVNTNTTDHVLFANQIDATLKKMSQDEHTMWSEKSVHLQPTRIDDVVEFDCHATHIRVLDTNHSPMPLVEVGITATTRVSVYLNNTYHRLSPNSPTTVKTDESGSITILQQTDNLSGVCYKMQPADNSFDPVLIDPMAGPTEILKKIRAGTGTDFDNTNIPTPDGKSQKLLISPEVSATDKDNVASAISQLITAKGSLPVDGSKANVNIKKKLDKTKNLTWGMSFDEKGVSYVTGDTALRNMGIDPGQVHGTTPRASFKSWIKAAAGDLLHWIKKAAEKVASIALTVVNGIHQFFVQIGDFVIQVALEVASAVTKAINAVLDKIKVLWDDIKGWLGFIFEWHDIVQTHKVMSRAITLYLNAQVKSLDSVKAAIDNVFQNAKDNLTTWANSADKISSTTVASQQAGGSSSAINTPQGQYGLYHTKNSLSSSKSTYNEPQISGISDLDSMLGLAQATIDNEKKVFTDTIDAVKDLAENFTSLTMQEIVSKLVGIIGAAILDSSKNVVDCAIDLLVVLVDGFIHLLTAEIQIPIISRLYERATEGSKLTILDLACLVAAIPATLAFKALKNKAPFPDNGFVNDLAAAKDLATFSNLLNHPTSSKLAKDPRSTNIPDYANIFQGICAAFAGVGALFTMITTGLKIAEDLDPGVPPPFCLRAVGFVAYVVYNMNTLPPAMNNTITKSTNWYDTMNYALTTIDVIKAFVDARAFAYTNVVWRKGTGAVESFINFVWLLPPIFAYVETHDAKDEDRLSLASSIAFDIGGVLTLFIDPEVTNTLSPLFAVAQGTITLVNVGINGSYSLSIFGAIKEGPSKNNRRDL